MSQLTDYTSVKKIAGIKIQKDGCFTRTDDVYDVNVADFIVEVDRDFLLTLSKQEVSNCIQQGLEICKSQLPDAGLVILGTHIQTNPSPKQPHITLNVVANTKITSLVRKINKGAPLLVL